MDRGDNDIGGRRGWGSGQSTRGQLRTDPGLGGVSLQLSRGGRGEIKAREPLTLQLEIFLEFQQSIVNITQSTALRRYSSTETPQPTHAIGI